MVRIQSEAIRSESLTDQVLSDGDGAVALFLGTVRDHNRGRKVVHLVYEAYTEMAEIEMARIETSVANQAVADQGHDPRRGQQDTCTVGP